METLTNEARDLYQHIDGFLDARIYDRRGANEYWENIEARRIYLQRLTALRKKLWHRYTRRYKKLTTSI